MVVKCKHIGCIHNDILGNCKRKEISVSNHGCEHLKYVKVAAIDFDGTLCKSKFPMAGEPIQETVDKVKALRENGYELILWTCRRGESLEIALEWCKQHGLIFESINAPTPRQAASWGPNVGPKVFADIYIDDRAVNVNSFNLEDYLDPVGRER